jgi:hypothetical protein
MTIRERVKAWLGYREDYATMVQLEQVREALAGIHDDIHSIRNAHDGLSLRVDLLVASSNASLKGLHDDIQTVSASIGSKVDSVAQKVGVLSSSNFNAAVSTRVPWYIRKQEIEAGERKTRQQIKEFRSEDE